MAVSNRTDFAAFQRQVDDLVAAHEVVTSNPYTAWFETADLSEEDVRQFAVQFSVFSNQFLVAQLKKMISADTLESMRASKEILANEIGVMFRSDRAPAAQASSLSDAEKDSVGDPELVGIEGSVDGGTFRFRAAHFEWLLRFGEPLGLSYNDMGKRRHGWAATLYFTDELGRIYGDGEGMVGMGASYAVEHWAAAGFWKQLIRGLSRFKKEKCPTLPLAFFTWHDRIEDNHAAHTSDELREAFEHPEFQGDLYMRAAAEMLDGVKAFWWGLDEERLRRHVEA